jgi:hypothetical protein
MDMDLSKCFSKASYARNPKCEKHWRIPSFFGAVSFGYAEEIKTCFEREIQKQYPRF